MVCGNCIFNLYIITSQVRQERHISNTDGNHDGKQLYHGLQANKENLDATKKRNDTDKPQGRTLSTLAGNILYMTQYLNGFC